MRLLLLCMFACRPDPGPDREDPIPPDITDTATIPVTEEGPRIAVPMIGDGMGPLHLDAASGYRHGTKLDAMRVDADAHGLFVGIEGTFEWDANAVVLLVDTDYGTGSGYPSLLGVVRDVDGATDLLLSGLQLTAPADPGFGADFVAVAFGGLELWLDKPADHRGLRGLTDPADLAWLASVVMFGDGSREADAPPIAGKGLEFALPWTSLYGELPDTASIAIAAVLVNSDGGYTSNQALPPFPSEIGAGSDPVALPGLVIITVEAGILVLE